MKCYRLSVILYGVETKALLELDMKHLESFEMLCRRRTEEIS